MDIQKQITSNYMMHWRVPKDIHVCKDFSSGSPLAILEFETKDHASGRRFGTNGMSFSSNVTSNEVNRCELISISKNRSSRTWILTLMEALARYPMQHEAFFGPYDTIESGSIDAGKGSPFNAIMLLPCSLDRSSTLVDVVANSVTISFLHIIGIYHEEISVIKKIGYSQFIEIVSGGGDARDYLYLDNSRSMLVL